MTRYVQLKRLLPFVGLVAAAVMALSAAPAGATIVCPAGVTPPSSYCQNVPPVAKTGSATNVHGTSATLNGTAGAGVAGGDPTTWYFQYGTTTSYGKTTSHKTLGSCPSGVTPPSNYCSTPSSTPVSADVSSLTPCTTYHYRLVATNPDGTTNGDDSTFMTKFAAPITKVKAPSSVTAGRKFTVKISLRFKANVTIQIRKKHSGAVKVIHLGNRGPGTIFPKLRAPHRPGHYTLRVIAKLSCGQQFFEKKLHVRKHHRHHHHR